MLNNTPNGTRTPLGWTSGRRATREGDARGRNERGEGWGFGGARLRRGSLRRGCGLHPHIHIHGELEGPQRHGPPGAKTVRRGPGGALPYSGGRRRIVPEKEAREARARRRRRGGGLRAAAGVVRVGARRRGRGGGMGGGRGVQRRGGVERERVARRQRRDALAVIVRGDGEEGSVVGVNDGGGLAADTGSRASSFRHHNAHVLPTTLASSDAPGSASRIIYLPVSPLLAALLVILSRPASGPASDQ
ncbi:hypothetical protein FB451DRAFT_1376974 [Mycena latifolia]|nr:hypothetical protein FB451DRAFT_1376974 [Mycena latifolia]